MLPWIDIATISSPGLNQLEAFSFDGQAIECLRRSLFLSRVYGPNTLFVLGGERDKALFVTIESCVLTLSSCGAVDHQC